MFPPLLTTFVVVSCEELSRRWSKSLLNKYSSCNRILSFNEMFHLNQKLFDHVKPKPRFESQIETLLKRILFASKWASRISLATTLNFIWITFPSSLRVIPQTLRASDYGNSKKSLLAVLRVLSSRGLNKEEEKSITVVEWRVNFRLQRKKRL